MPRSSDFLIAPLALGLTAAPLGAPALAFALLALGDVAIALIIARRIAARPIKPETSLVVVQGDMPVQLRRRTEPGLRARRPRSVIEMQERWRAAAEAYRRSRRGA